MLVLGLVDIPLWLILLPLGLFLLYMYGTHNHDFFKNQGIPGPKPLPFIGNGRDFMSADLMKVDINFRQKYGDTFGIFLGKIPTLVSFDLEVLSEVTVKRFSHFQNRLKLFGGDKVFDNMLTNMDDDQWKHTRSVMSPTFTTGKLRQMAGEINRSAKLLSKCIGKSEGPFEVREHVSAYTMDVIASTAFGIRVDSQSGDSSNIFVKHGKKMTDFSFTNPLILASMISSQLAKLMISIFGFSLLDKPSTNFFLDIIKQTIDSRTEEDRKRSDFVQLMWNAKQGHAIHSKEDESKLESHDGNKQSMTDNEVLANALIFFFAGYDTTSIGLTQLIYCLALNPECQEKVHQEIDSIVGNKADVTYDDVMKMQYLDQCLQESLRLYPGTFRFDRECSADVEIKGIKLKKGMGVAVPAYAIHMDPEHYKNPTKFDPGRFSTEEKAKRSPLVWLPFGYGPRNCIGMRLALYEMKVAVAQLLKDHCLTTCSKTEVPLTWNEGQWLKSKNGVWLQAEKRN